MNATSSRNRFVGDSPTVALTTDSCTSQPLARNSKKAAI